MSCPRFRGHDLWVLRASDNVLNADKPPPVLTISCLCLSSSKLNYCVRGLTKNCPSKYQRPFCVDSLDDYWMAAVEMNHIWFSHKWPLLFGLALILSQLNPTQSSRFFLLQWICQNFNLKSLKNNTKFLEHISINTSNIFKSITAPSS